MAKFLGAAFNKVAAASPPPASKPTTTKAATPKGGFSFLKRGSAAQEAIAEEEARIEQAKAEAGRLYRFFLDEGEEGVVITFLDGNLDADGTFYDQPMFREHTVQLNGKWHNFPCTAEMDQTQPCPICEKGDRPALVCAFTVLDHRVYVSKKGANAGKSYQHTRKLFIAKPDTLKLLKSHAKKRGGLAGCHFEVSRIGDKAARVGSHFEFVSKFANPAEIMAKFGLQTEGVLPADYEDELGAKSYVPPEKLISLGVGKAPIGVGYGTAAKSDLASEL
jgi:hypothetical protein